VCIHYRTARVLDALGEHPGAKDRQRGDFAGAHDAGRI
jgi:hypothetical protein